MSEGNLNQDQRALRLNAVCPYFTMYPIEFPLRVLRHNDSKSQWILDPYCGRGTTNYAARLLGIRSVGFDSSPIAVAIAKAKLHYVTSAEVVNAAEELLRSKSSVEIPESPFWDLAYSHVTLEALCRLRTGLMRSRLTKSEVMLRAILLGALHGPRSKQGNSYFSNQCPRTFSPKPRYAIKFWRKHKLRPQDVDIVGLIKRRADRYLESQPAAVGGAVRAKDSRRASSFKNLPKFAYVVTSPPYYGMRTYLQDQWIRHWFLGGTAEVDYEHSDGQLSHGGQEEFSEQLNVVWKNCALVAKTSAKLVCRFGSIQDRNIDPIALIRASFKDSGWRITTIRNAGLATDGKRQAHQFGDRSPARAKSEYDIYARRD